jgi:hypothetical protein
LVNTNGSPQEELKKKLYCFHSPWTSVVKFNAIYVLPLFVVYVYLALSILCSSIFANGDA